ncbi:MAG: hypothetical protein WCG16_14255 [Methylococcales bacterium]
MATIKNQVIPQITGYGLKGFEDNLGYFEKNFFDNVEKFSVYDKQIDFMSENAAAYFQEEKFKKVYSKQMTELSWFEKNIYINPEKEKRLLDERTKDAQVKGLLVDLAIWGAGKLLKYGSAYIANENEKKRLAKSSYQILAYISGNKGEIPESNQHIEPYPYQKIPFPATIPHPLAQALLHQRDWFKDLPVHFVPIDFTLPEDGFDSVNYGLDVLWDVIETALPKSVIGLLRDSEQHSELLDFHAKEAHSHILGYALLNMGAGAIPLAGLLLVLSVQAKLDKKSISYITPEITQIFMSQYIDILGKYAIQLYSGQITLDDIEPTSVLTFD